MDSVTGLKGLVGDQWMVLIQRNVSADREIKDEINSGHW